MANTSVIMNIEQLLRAAEYIERRERGKVGKDPFVLVPAQCFCCVDGGKAANAGLRSGMNLMLSALCSVTPCHINVPHL